MFPRKCKSKLAFSWVVVQIQPNAWARKSQAQNITYNVPNRGMAKFK